LAECRSPARGKPCWLTEWGLPAVGAACDSHDSPRAAVMGDMLIDFRQYVREGRLEGLLYYAWTDDEYGIYRCGAVTDSGRVALDPNILE
jgi:hypothetical protein